MATVDLPLLHLAKSSGLHHAVANDVRLIDHCILVGRVLSCHVNSLEVTLSKGMVGQRPHSYEPQPHTHTETRA